MTRVVGSRIPSINLVASTIQYSSPKIEKRSFDLSIYSSLDITPCSILCISATARALAAHSSPPASALTAVGNVDEVLLQLKNMLSYWPASRRLEMPLLCPPNGSTRSTLWLSLSWPGRQPDAQDMERSTAGYLGNRTHKQNLVLH